MKLFNWINPVWIMDNFLTTYFDPVTATAVATAATAAAAPTAATVLPAVAAPSILGGGLTGAGMITAGAPIIPGLLTTAAPSALGTLGTLGTLGGTAMGAAEAAIPGSIESAGLVLNPATGTYLNPEYFALAESSMPLYTGGGSALSQLGTGLGSLGSEINTGLGSLGGSTLEALKANPTQTAGLGLNIYDRMNQQSQVQPPQLGIIRPQESSQYQPVLNTILQKRKPYSLLG